MFSWFGYQSSCCSYSYYYNMLSSELYSCFLIESWTAMSGVTFRWLFHSSDISCLSTIWSVTSRRSYNQIKFAYLQEGPSVSSSFLGPWAWREQPQLFNIGSECKDNRIRDVHLTINDSPINPVYRLFSSKISSEIQWWKLSWVLRLSLNYINDILLPF